MAQDYKVLAQNAPAATTDVFAYTVPAGTQAVISTLIVANRSSSVAASYRIAVLPAPQELETKHYIAYDVPLAVSDSATLTLGLTLSPGDKVLVYGSTADLSFNVFGVEFS